MCSALVCLACLCLDVSALLAVCWQRGIALELAVWFVTFGEVFLRDDFVVLYKSTVPFQHCGCARAD